MAYSLTTLKGSVKLNINEAARDVIIAGFESSALGEAHRYDSDQHDQLNLIGAIALGTPMHYRCLRLSNGMEDYVLHTPAQLQQVVADGAARKLMILQAAKVGRDTVDTAADTSEVLAAADAAIGSFQPL